MAHTLIITSKYCIKHFEQGASWLSISSFIQIPEAPMRSKACRLQYIIATQNMELLLLFSIISPSSY